MESAESSWKNSTHLGVESFEDLRHRVMESEELSHIKSDGTPTFLGDHPRLYAACAELAVEVGNKDLDLITWRRMQGMQGLLNLYLDEGLELSWRKTLELVSKTQGHGMTHTRRIREWTVQFLQSKALPLCHLNQARWTVLHNEDIASEIKLQMVKKLKQGLLRANNLVDLIASPEMQKSFSEKGICKPSISKATATRWLQKLDWRYKSARNGMYIDGYEREDVVAY